MDDSAATPSALIEKMFHLSSAYIDARALWLVAKLGIPDLLVGGPRSVGDLASQVEVSPAALQRILRVVAANGVLSEPMPGEFALTPLGETLTTSSELSMRDWVIWCGGPLFSSFRDAMHSLETGQPAFERVHGSGLYEYLRDHPDDARALGGAMVAYGREVITTLLTECDLTGVARIVDVGAGPGSLDIALLRAYPSMRATLFDLPHAIEQARAVVGRTDVADRCDFVTGNFFETPIPAGGDAYVLSAVLHNWPDDKCVEILASCRKAVGASGRLFVLDTVLPDANASHFAKKSDLVMLVALGGHERTSAAYGELLENAGFKLTGVHLSPNAMQVLEAEPV